MMWVVQPRKCDLSGTKPQLIFDLRYKKREAIIEKGVVSEQTKVFRANVVGHVILSVKSMM
jgi:hypothetical protein